MAHLSIVRKDPVSMWGDVTFILTVPAEDFFRAILRRRKDPFDKALLMECNNSNSVADALLGLEVVIREVEKQKAGATPPSPAPPATTPPGEREAHDALP